MSGGLSRAGTYFSGQSPQSRRNAIIMAFRVAELYPERSQKQILRGACPERGKQVLRRCAPQDDREWAQNDKRRAPQDDSRAVRLRRFHVWPNSLLKNTHALVILRSETRHRSRFGRRRICQLLIGMKSRFFAEPALSRESRSGACAERCEASALPKAVPSLRSGPLRSTG